MKKAMPPALTDTQSVRAVLVLIENVDSYKSRYNLLQLDESLLLIYTVEDTTSLF